MKKFALSVLLALAILPLNAGNRRQVAIVAHRGYWTCPEGGNSHNSIASLKACQEGDFWGSEFDVNMTLDGELLVFHDDAVAGMKFAEHNASEFAEVKLPNGEKIPTLDEYLTQFEQDKTCRLVFELKWHTGLDREIKAVNLSIEKLKAHGLYNPKQVIFISFDLQQCILFAEKCPGFTVQYLGSEKDRNPDFLAPLGINGIDTGYWIFYSDPTWYTRARNHKMSVNCWTVDNEKDIRTMIEMGADYITTNYPDRCRAILEEMGIQELKAGKNFK